MRDLHVPGRLPVFVELDDGERAIIVTLGPLDKEVRDHQRFTEAKGSKRVKHDRAARRFREYALYIFWRID